MLRRHRFLTGLSLSYLGFVAWVTLTPLSMAPTASSLVVRALDRLQREPGMSWLTYDRAEFVANVALFVPVGLFLLLLVGARWWLIALLGAFMLSGIIETAQQSIPGRVPDQRDLLANQVGSLIGMAVALVLTLRAMLRRARDQQHLSNLPNDSAH